VSLHNEGIRNDSVSHEMCYASYKPVPTWINMVRLALPSVFSFLFFCPTFFLLSLPPLSSLPPSFPFASLLLCFPCLFSSFVSSLWCENKVANACRSPSFSKGSGWRYVETNICRRGRPLRRVSSSLPSSPFFSSPIPSLPFTAPSPSL
jgi:hypothetical protein